MTIGRLSHLLFYALILRLTATAQIQQRGNLVSYIDSTVKAMPSAVGSNDYLPPTAEEFARFRSTVENLLALRIDSASSTAASLDYRVLSFIDTTGLTPSFHSILERQANGAHHWGTVVVASQPIRPQLVLQSPHPIFDAKTAQQGAWIYRSVGARVLFVSGTHRCNNMASSPCAGTTTVCSSMVEPFRLSDPAHNVDHPLQALTHATVATILDPVVLQLHGFGKDPGDPDLILSNGTRQTPANDLIAGLRDQLMAIDNSLTFRIAHIDTSWTLLTGTTNVQGRLINGSLAPCSQSASVTSGRFIHMEQAFLRLRDNEVSWSRVAEAVGDWIPASSATLVQTPVLATRYLEAASFPNPFNPATIIQFHLPAEAHVNVVAYDMTGRLVGQVFDGLRPSGLHSVSWEPRMASGAYLIRISATPPEPQSLPLERMLRLLIVR